MEARRGAAPTKGSWASLDRDRGVFRWQPTVEFSGSCAFVFVRRGCDKVERRIRMVVTLKAKVIPCPSESSSPQPSRSGR